MSCRSSNLANNTAESGSAFLVPSDPNALLASIPANLLGQRVYAYIVTTIKTRPPNYRLQQTGSAPNFSGGRITLCTCKHKDRATFHPSSDPHDPWKDVWVAGLTSKSEDPSRSLAYLMRVERSFLSQLELWRYLPVTCRRAKSASRSETGDCYEPKLSATSHPYDPSSYHPPMGGHVHSSARHPNSWYHDVMQWGQRSQPHRLLLGHATQSYRWIHVKMILKLDVIGHSAHHRMYPSLSDFVANLQEFDP